MANHHTQFEFLQHRIPLMDGKVHFPAGFRDFRGLTFPCEFRAGPYQYVEQPRLWKYLCGERPVADAMAATLHEIGMESIRIEETPGTFIQLLWEWPESPL